MPRRAPFIKAMTYLMRPILRMPQSSALAFLYTSSQVGEPWMPSLFSMLGFFRIWEIPYGHIYGLLGRFRPALPLTPEEIKGFGFTQNPAALTRPLLTEERLEELADAAGGWGFKHYFHKNEDGLYELADEVKTQRGVCERVQDERLRTTLCDLIADVLFIEDP